MTFPLMSFELLDVFKELELMEEDFYVGPLVSPEPFPYGSSVFPHFTGFEVLGGAHKEALGHPNEHGLPTKQIDPERYVAFIEQQIAFTELFPKAPYKWINLSSEALHLPDVQSRLRDVLLVRKLFRQAARYTQIGFELTEFGFPTSAVANLLHELQDAGYYIAFDDIGSGDRTDPDVVRRMCEWLLPYKLKFDVGVVDPQSAARTMEQVNAWITMLGYVPGAITLEGVTVNPQAGSLTFQSDWTDVARTTLYNASNDHEIESWRLMMHELSAHWKCAVDVQLSPLTYEDMSTIKIPFT